MECYQMWTQQKCTKKADFFYNRTHSPVSHNNHKLLDKNKEMFNFKMLIQMRVK